MKSKGFTAIEIMIVICILAIVLITVINAYYGVKNPSTVSIGYNGLIEERCISGFKFVVGQDGRATQILDSFGKGVSCSGV